MKSIIWVDGQAGPVGRRPAAGGWGKSAADSAAVLSPCRQNPAVRVPSRSETNSVESRLTSPSPVVPTALESRATFLEWQRAAGL